MAAPRSDDQGFYFFESQHFIYGCSFHIQNFAFQRENGLRPSVPSLLARTAGGISFNDEYLRLAGVASLAIGQLARQSQPFQNTFSQYAFLGGFGRFSSF